MVIDPDDGSEESWRAQGNAEKMRANFRGWEPRYAPLFKPWLALAEAAPRHLVLAPLSGISRVEKLLKLVPSTLRWKLMDRSPLKTWIHKSNKVVLLGDACHPMLVSHL